MSRFLFALPILALGGCAATSDLTATDASRILSDGKGTEVVCTEPVVTTEADGSTASSMVCRRL